MAVDARIDAYIAKSVSFAAPILTHLRAAVHAACPQVEETIRWGMPSFTYNGSILCQMAAFKAHASFGFWQREQATGEAPAKDKDAMGQFGRLTQVGDLPSDAELAAMIERAMAVIDSGVKAPRPIKHPKPPVALPDDLAAALVAMPAAQATYDGFPEGQKREYVEWITDAKRAETRASRIADAVAWMAEGKRRNWKYERC
ncbi:YdeI/OmpD-associated family protein [Sphingomonas montanisoli]|uniref:YdhG-like domain-containing protein n=1 Tax=Sphingomonas montanisoli TaxID=2606412 RepID=A0A5D9CD38_9SPHN|nr:YdeI/OmpD-associated family protein [Sphingomonas montanisoli]TZG29062.1 hypothetical protein FYJ91_02690 [Sphingomonas montanisoli]